MTSLAEIKASDLAVLTIAETAAVMRLDERTVRRGCVEGQIPSVHVGRRVLVLREPLVRLLEGVHLPADLVPGAE